MKVIGQSEIRLIAFKGQEESGWKL